MQNQNTQEENHLGSDDTDQSGAITDKHLLKNKAEAQVRENEDASLQDDSYAFDSDNIGNEDVHDVTDFDNEGYENIGEEDLQ